MVGDAWLAVDEDGVARFLGHREVSDYPGPGRAARALVSAVSERGWTLDAENQRPRFAAALEQAARAAGLQVTVEPDEPVAVLALPDDWATYLGGLTRHSRHELLRKRRRIGAHDLRTADEATLDDDLDTFFAFFRQAHGAKGTFMTRSIEAFMRATTRATLDRRMLRLDVLERDGNPLAIALGFQNQSTYYLYNMAYDPAARRLSPGIVLVADAIERAIHDHLTDFDFMRGLERYKLEFGATPSSLMRVKISH
jgi:CelD/BcsL family acetyltransferase involved in cellulose biosynthesis